MIRKGFEASGNNSPIPDVLFLDTCCIVFLEQLTKTLSNNCFLMRVLEKRLRECPILEFCKHYGNVIFFNVFFYKLLDELLATDLKVYAQKK